MWYFSNILKAAKGKTEYTFVSVYLSQLILFSGYSTTLTRYIFPHILQPSIYLCMYLSIYPQIPAWCINCISSELYWPCHQALWAQSVHEVFINYLNVLFYGANFLRAGMSVFHLERNPFETSARSTNLTQTDPQRRINCSDHNTCL